MTNTTTMTSTLTKQHSEVREQGKFMISHNDQPITILLVDDDPDCRMLIRDAIAECKVSNSVYEVANGAEALDFLHRRGSYEGAPRPGLIYLDIEMPGLNGQDALKQIKASPNLRD